MLLLLELLLLEEDDEPGLLMGRLEAEAAAVVRICLGVVFRLAARVGVAEYWG